MRPNSNVPVLTSSRLSLFLVLPGINRYTRQYFKQLSADRGLYKTWVQLRPTTLGLYQRDRSIAEALPAPPAGRASIELQLDLGRKIQLVGVGIRVRQRAAHTGKADFRRQSRILSAKDGFEVLSAEEHDQGHLRHQQDDHPCIHSKNLEESKPDRIRRRPEFIIRTSDLSTVPALNHLLISSITPLREAALCASTQCPGN
jgi:hypothetical protein